jgi:hypothetical protein
MNAVEDILHGNNAGIKISCVPASAWIYLLQFNQMLAP